MANPHKKLLHEIHDELTFTVKCGVGLGRIEKLIPKVRAALDRLEHPMDKNKLHSEIMNIKVDDAHIKRASNDPFLMYFDHKNRAEIIEIGYSYGHRDARHDAAELVLKGDK